MKYMTRVVKTNKKPKDQEDIPKRRGGRPEEDLDAAPKQFKKVYDPEHQKHITKKI